MLVLPISLLIINSDKPSKVRSPSCHPTVGFPRDTFLPSLTLTNWFLGPLVYGTGQPVYPGIEISWSYLLRETYDKPYRINRKHINPGDLNRLLSCPWYVLLSLLTCLDGSLRLHRFGLIFRFRQSDFYLCRNHWWPACRPDSVVPETEYKRIMSGGKSYDKTGVVPWERGIRPQHEDVFPGTPALRSCCFARSR